MEDGCFKFKVELNDLISKPRKCESYSFVHMLKLSFHVSE